MSRALPELNEVQVWAELLDDLEISLQDGQDAAMGRGSGLVSRWNPPVSMPLLPEPLLPRARELVERQAAVVRLLEEARRGSRQQLRLLGMDSVKGIGGGPHFIDHRA